MGRSILWRECCFAVLTALLLCPRQAQALPPVEFPAVRPGAATSEPLTLYSTLDVELARPVILAFQKKHPEIAVKYYDMLTGDVFERVVAESNTGGKTADLVFSSAMDLQVKSVNDGYGQAVITPDTAQWPHWANWRNTAYALTFEPAVFAYHKPSFAKRQPPSSRAEVLEWVENDPKAVEGRIGTYDVVQSGVGHLFLARDEDLFPQIWHVVEAIGAVHPQQFSTTGALLERIADGRLSFGYNLLGSYVADYARREPNLGLILPQDFTVVISRVAVVPRYASSPELGQMLLSYLMSPEGQTELSKSLHLPAVSLKVAGQTHPVPQLLDAGVDFTQLRLKPLPLSLGLLAYLDGAAQQRLNARWRQIFGQ